MKTIIKKIAGILLVLTLILPSLVYLCPTAAVAEPVDGIENAQSPQSNKLPMQAQSAKISGQPLVDRLPASHSSITVFYNRHFSEGWNFDNGFTTTEKMRGNEYSLQYDFASDINHSDASYKNYYFHFTQKSTQNGFLPLNIAENATQTVNKLYLEFDVKASTGASIPNIIEFINAGPNVSNTFTFGASLNNGSLYVLGTNVGKIEGEWCHVAMEIDYSYGKSLGKSQIKYTAYVGSVSQKIELIEQVSNSVSDQKSPYEIRIGRCYTSPFKSGDWYGLDNLKVYSADGFANLDPSDLGVTVNTDKTKDFVIDSVTEYLPTPAIIAESALNMKVNSPNALIKGKTVKLFEGNSVRELGKPYKSNGRIMVPLLPILEFTGAEYRFNSNGLGCDFYIGNSYRSLSILFKEVQTGTRVLTLTAMPEYKVIDGKNQLFICLDDVETLFLGYYVTYDDVGFISISEYDDYLNRDLDEEFMRELMKRFVYEEIEEDSVYQTVKTNTNNFDHPYMYVDQERFDFLHNVFSSKPGDEIYDDELYSYLEESVDYAKNYYFKYADTDAEGNYLGLKLGHWEYDSLGFASWCTECDTENHSVAIAPYPDSKGYDPAGGRLNVLSDGEGALSIACEALGYAYQVTRNENYAKFVYDWALALCSWEHWAPGHYLNVGNTARNISLAYDFLYDVWQSLELDTTKICDELYRLCTYTAWRSLKGLPTEYKNQNGSESMAYWAHIGNWNPVCSSGVLACALISLENSNYISDASFVLSKTVHYLGQNGFNYFAFDGSYRESAGYWAATIRFSQYCVLTVKNAFGTDFGLSNAPGMDISNNFGSHMESSDYVSWNYHDDWVINMPSYWFYMAAELFDKPEFAALRYYHIRNGKSTYRLDALFYDKEMIERGQVILPLDYIMDSIDATVSRDSWDSGALYTGIMGGINNVAHGQYDSGNWIYENNGIRWFCDLGADDYNLYGGGLNRGYYRYSTEGNNTVAITSRQDIMPHGQVLSKGGEITSAFINEYGSATVIDQSAVYGGKDVVSYARRGMLLTNDRKTVVIQDEIAFNSAESVCWFAHYRTDQVDSVEISEDGRTAYLSKGKGVFKKSIRVSLISPDKSLKFEKIDTYNLVLDATPEWGYSESKNGIPEYSRDVFMRLVIKAKNVKQFNVAVVIEEYDEQNPTELGYNLGYKGDSSALQPMQSWVPEKDYRITDTPVNPEPNKPSKPGVSTLFSNSNLIKGCIERGTYLTTEFEDFYIALAEIEYVLPFYSSDMTSELLEISAIFNEAKELYNSYVSNVNKSKEKTESIVIGLLGLKK